MKILKVTISLLFLFIVIQQGSRIYHNFSISRDLKNEKRKNLKKSAEVLNKCFDLKNKSQRSLGDSMKLLKYCLKEYRTELGYLNGFLL